jgi:ERCC4-related helicase
MIEGGVAKDMDDYHVLNNAEKIQAILLDFGDSEKNVIMYHYKAELLKLQKIFIHTTLLQATSYAEGVDLSMYDNLIIYSQDFSTSRHSQRRARQANMNRTTPIKVHFYLVKGGISEQIYKTVSINKKNFIDSIFIREGL